MIVTNIKIKALLKCYIFSRAFIKSLLPKVISLSFDLSMGGFETICFVVEFVAFIS